MRRIDHIPDSSRRAKVLALPQSTEIPSYTPVLYGQELVLTPTLVAILQQVRTECATSDEAQSEGDLQGMIDYAARRLGLEVSPYERNLLLSQLERESCPFGILQPLVDNPEISDIIITSSSRIAVQKGRENFLTDIKFSDQDAYEAFVEKLLLKGGSAYSVKKPIADAMIGSFARIHVVHRCLCESGPYLTIRLNRFGRVVMEDLVDFGMAAPEILSYLRLLVHAGQTMLVVGEVGTGGARGEFGQEVLEV